MSAHTPGPWQETMQGLPLSPRGYPVPYFVAWQMDNGAARMVLRFKSARAIDTLIDALKKHRADVWGDR